MDYTKFFSRRSIFQRDNLIRRVTTMYLETPDSISLSSGMPNPKCFPFKKLSVTYGKKDTTLTQREIDAALQYGPSQGYFPLINKWKAFQSRWHNPPFKNLNVAIVPGSQDGFHKILDLILDENDPMMVQTPAYAGTLAAIYSMNPEFIGIPQDANGIIPEEIQRVCESRVENNQKLPKALYVNPIGANPTGTVLTTDRKHEIYRLAQKYDFLIIEDDAYYFVHFLEKQPPSFLSMDIDGRVIRLDSFSKIISSGLRLGAVTAPDEIITKLIVSLQNTVLHASSLSQMLMFKLLEDWSEEEFKNHIKEIQNFYKSQRDMMIRSVEKHLTGLAEWTVPQGGMFVWIKLKNVDNALDLLMNKLKPKGVFVIPGNTFNYDDQKPDNHIRLCYSFATADEVDKGLQILENILRQEVVQ